MKNVVLIILFSFLTNAQSFFPLEVGNEWYFQRNYTDWGTETETDTFSVRVTNDTLMSNGKNYFELQRPFIAKYVRVDSNCVFVYDDYYEEDIKLIDFEMGLNERRYVDFQGICCVELIDIDTSTIFGFKSIYKTFTLDGLVINDITFSNKYGPIGRYSPGEPPGTSLTSVQIIGCQISDTSYGDIVSVEEKEQLYSKFFLEQNYPNPFNPSTTIKFNIPVDTRRGVSLRVYDILGREVKTLINKNLSPGNYKVTFDGSDLTSGVYFYVLQSGNTRLSKKMLLLK